MLIKRSFSPGHYIKGSWVEGVPADTAFYGTAQPASGKTLEILPEEKRNSETITVFAPIGIAFTPAEPGAEKSGDIIIWETRQYEVQNAKKWNCGLLPHWELVCTRCKDGES